MALQDDDDHHDDNNHNQHDDDHHHHHNGDHHHHHNVSKGSAFACLRLAHSPLKLGLVCLLAVLV